MQLDATSGTEKLYLAWSRAPVPQFERAKDQTDALVHGNVVIRAREQLAELQQLLAKYRIPDSQVRTNEDAQKTVLTSEQDVLVHLIRLNHL
jgi:activator of HSP90 ATPase